MRKSVQCLQSRTYGLYVQMYGHVLIALCMHVVFVLSIENLSVVGTHHFISTTLCSYVIHAHACIVQFIQPPFPFCAFVIILLSSLLGATHRDRQTDTHHFVCQFFVAIVFFFFIQWTIELIRSLRSPIRSTKYSEIFAKHIETNSRVCAVCTSSMFRSADLRYVFTFCFSIFRTKIQFNCIDCFGSVLGILFNLLNCRKQSAKQILKRETKPKQQHQQRHRNSTTYHLNSHTKNVYFFFFSFFVLAFATWT